MSNKVAIAKFVIHTATTMGVSKIVRDIVSNNTTAETTADAAKVWVGGFVIGSLVTDATSKHVDEKLDQVAAWWENRKETETTN